MRQRRVADDVREQVDVDLDSAEGDVSRLFSVASRLLSQLSGEVGFVVAPDALHTVVKSLRFLSVAPGKILVVQVNEPDVVLSRVLETDIRYSPVELDAISERLTREFGGLTLHEIRRRLLAALAREKAEADRFIGSAAALASRALESSDAEDRLFFEGTANLL